MNFFYKIPGYRSVASWVFLLIYLAFPSYVIAADGKKIEEGWRYHASFQLNIRVQQDPLLEKVFDRAPVHKAMAQILLPSSSKQKYTSIFRFTPIIAKGDQIGVGPTIRLTDGAIMCASAEALAHIPVYELGFMSGFCEPGKGDLAPHITTLGLKRPGIKEKANAFGVMPPYEKREPFSYIALRFLQRVYIDPELFESRVQFRYPDQEEKSMCFGTGNYRPIKEAHDDTKRRIKERRDVIAESFKEMAQRAMVMNLEEAMAPHLKTLEDGKGVVKNFNNNPRVNSYTCAEQAGLDFLFDERVVQYLSTSLDISNPDVKALLVDLHCSHTPCALCATSLARETENGGIFKIIANGKPVFLFCSCQNQYERKPPMIQYPETTFLDGAALSLDRTKLEGRIIAPVTFNATLPIANALPFPIVLMKYSTKANEPGLFDVDDTLLKTMLAAPPK